MAPCQTTQGRTCGIVWLILSPCCPDCCLKETIQISLIRKIIKCLCQASWRSTSLSPFQTTRWHLEAGPCTFQVSSISRRIASQNLRPLISTSYNNSLALTRMRATMNATRSLRHHPLISDNSRGLKTQWRHLTSTASSRKTISSSTSSREKSHSKVPK